MSMGVCVRTHARWRWGCWCRGGHGGGGRAGDGCDGHGRNGNGGK